MPLLIYSTSNLEVLWITFYYFPTSQQSIRKDFKPLFIFRIITNPWGLNCFLYQLLAVWKISAVVCVGSGDTIFTRLSICSLWSLILTLKQLIQKYFPPISSILLSISMDFQNKHYIHIFQNQGKRESLHLCSEIELPTLHWPFIQNLDLCLSFNHIDLLTLISKVEMGGCGVWHNHHQVT